jgi:hypothetical protein
VIGAALAWRGADGALLLPLPLDYLSWTHDSGDFFDHPGLAAADKTALIAGDASMLAQRQLTQRGWNIALRAPYDGAPAYAHGGFAPRNG